MVGKDEEKQQHLDEGLARVRLIADKKRHLEETADLVQQQIKSCFERLSSGLRGRERQLLRQVEAINRQRLSLVQSSSEHLVPTDESLSLRVDLSLEEDLLQRLTSFGRINLSNALAVNNSEPYKAEEYIEAREDVVNFDKSLKSEADEFDVSSVIRWRKRGGTAEPIISINLNCTTCSATDSTRTTNHRLQEVSVAVAANNIASGSTCAVTKKLDASPASPESRSSSSCSYNYEKYIIKKNEDDASSSSEEEDEIPSANELTAQMEKFNIEEVDSNNGNCTSDNNESSKEIVNDNSEKINSDDEPGATTDGNAEKHPVQIQQWLQQILEETETEPIMHEFGQIISRIPPPKPRLYRESPAVET